MYKMLNSYREIGQKDVKEEEHPFKKIHKQSIEALMESMT